MESEWNKVKLSVFTEYRILIVEEPKEPKKFNKADKQVGKVKRSMISL